VRAAAGAPASLDAAAEAPAAAAAVAAPRSRRAALAATLAAAAACLAAAAPPRALAFGHGFPGYDLNIEAQKRASDRTRSEAAEQKRLAAEFRARKAAAAAAAAGGQ
jgi:hypothetical protein